MFSKKNIIFGIFALFLWVFIFFKNKNFNQDYDQEIKFSISPRIYPFEFYDEKKNVNGFDFDFAKLLAKELKRKPIIKDSPIISSFRLLEMNEFDAIISTIMLSDLRKKQKDFLLSDSYFQDDMIFLFRKEDQNLKKIEELNKKKISCSYGCFMFEDWFKSNLPNAEQLFFDSQPLELHALFEKKIDAILINRHEGLYLVSKYKEKLTYLDDFELKVDYTILVNKNNHKLHQEINDTIKKIHQSDEFQVLKKKWKLNE